MNKKVEIEFYDCNYRSGGITYIECKEFKQVDEFNIEVDGAKIRFGNEIKEIEITKNNKGLKMI